MVVLKFAGSTNEQAKSCKVFLTNSGGRMHSVSIVFDIANVFCSTSSGHVHHPAHNPLGRTRQPTRNGESTALLGVSQEQVDKKWQTMDFSTIQPVTVMTTNGR